LLGVVPHDIDWVKDRVRWYWETKLFKNRRAHVTTALVQDNAEPKEKESCSSATAAIVPMVVVTEAPHGPEASSAAAAPPSAKIG